MQNIELKKIDNKEVIIDMQTRACPGCSNEYRVMSTSKQRFCSVSCESSNITCKKEAVVLKSNAILRKLTMIISFCGAYTDFVDW